MNKDKQNNKKFDWTLFKRLVPYIKKYYLLGIFSFCCLLVVDVISVLQPYFIKIGIDKNITSGDLPGLIKTIKLLTVLLFSGLFFHFLFNYTIQYLGQKLIFDLRMDLFEHLLRLSNRFFDKTPVGRNLTTVTNDVEAVREFISEGIVTIISNILKIIFILLAMLFLNFRLALLALLTLPFFCSGYHLFSQKCPHWLQRGEKSYS